jgi:hypothetical protein
MWLAKIKRDDGLMLQIGIESLEELTRVATAPEVASAEFIRLEDQDVFLHPSIQPSAGSGPEIVGGGEIDRE